MPGFVIISPGFLTPGPHGPGVLSPLNELGFALQRTEALGKRLVVVSFLERGAFQFYGAGCRRSDPALIGCSKALAGL